MVLGALLGSALGLVGGTYVGSFLFASGRPKDYGFILSEADREAGVRMPMSGPVNSEMRALKQYTSHWTTWPDYERWVMINRVVERLWPDLTTAILEDIVKPQAKAVISQMKVLEKYVDDIMLGPISLLDKAHPDGLSSDKKFKLGTKAIRLGGMKVYSTSEDEVILELPVLWGADNEIDVAVYAKVGSFRFYIPLSVSDIQLKAVARVTLNPLVEEIPCIGGVTVSLLEVPHVDFRLSLFHSIDLLAVPGIKDALSIAIAKVTKDMIVYPNSMSFPLKAAWGIPPRPQGMLEINLHHLEAFKTTDLLGKGEPFVLFETRPGRPARSRTLNYGKEQSFNQKLYVVVDDFRTQRLKVLVMDSDPGKDTPVGVAWVDLSEKVYVTDEDQPQGQEVIKPREFIAEPGQMFPMIVRLDKPEVHGMVQGVVRNASRIVTAPTKGLSKLFKRGRTSPATESPSPPPSPSPRSTGRASSEKVDHGQGLVHFTLAFIPFSSPDDEEEEEDEAKKKAAASRPPERVVSQSVKLSDRGLLTVKVIKCFNLGSEQGSCDPYVELLLVDPEAANDDVQVTDVVWNDTSPAYYKSFDFVNITVGSELYITVWDKATVSDKVFAVAGKGSFGDQMLGKLRILVKDVAANARLKDRWVLQEVQSGEIELCLEWSTVVFDTDMIPTSKGSTSQ